MRIMKGKFRDRRCRVSSSIVRVLPPGVPNRLLQPRHLVWRACDRERRYTFPASGTHSNAREHSLPIKTSVRLAAYEADTIHIHDIVIYNKCGSFRLWFVSDANLPDATIAPEEVVQVVASDLVVQVLDKQDAVCTWG